MPGKIYVGDIGTEILVDLQEDISMAMEHVLLVKKPDGTEDQWATSIHNDRYLKYICQVGDLDQKGKYKIQPQIVISGWKGLGETVKLIVYEKFN